MGQAGTKTIRITDSSLSTEIFVSGSSRHEESNWDVLNSTISGSNRVKRDMGTLSFPLPANVTVVDNNILHSPEAVDLLWILVCLNIFMFALICIQFRKLIFLRLKEENFIYHFWKLILYKRNIFLVLRGYEMAKIYWEGDSTRIAPPASYPHAYGVTGPMTVNLNPRRNIVVNDVSNEGYSPETEITIVEGTDETVGCGHAVGFSKLKN